MGTTFFMSSALLDAAIAECRPVAASDTTMFGREFTHPVSENAADGTIRRLKLIANLLDQNANLLAIDTNIGCGLDPEDRKRIYREQQRVVTQCNALKAEAWNNRPGTRLRHPFDGYGENLPWRMLEFLSGNWMYTGGERRQVAEDYRVAYYREFVEEWGVAVDLPTGRRYTWMKWDENGEAYPL